LSDPTCRGPIPTAYMAFYVAAYLGIYLAFFLSLHQVATVALAQGANVTVCPEGCDYSSIKAAVFAARTGDVVLIESGRYYEHLKVDKSITLLGTDAGAGIPILDATGCGCPIIISADGVVVEGLKMMNGGPNSSGILVLSDENVIRNNDASNNYIGIRLVGSNNSTVLGNSACGNLEFGLRLEGCKGNLIAENVLMDNFLGDAFDDGSNRWDDGAVGNRYGDYDDPEEGCADEDGDGVCDLGREVPGGSSIDRFPLLVVG